jgi:hypothetical protein
VREELTIVLIPMPRPSILPIRAIASSSLSESGFRDASCSSRDMRVVITSLIEPRHSFCLLASFSAAVLASKRASLAVVNAVLSAVSAASARSSLRLASA